jgi:hypothetical protein
MTEPVAAQEPDKQQTIDKERLIRFLQLEAELQEHQGNRSKIEHSVILEFVVSDDKTQQDKINKLESWLNKTWRKGRKPSELSASELIGE